MTSKRISRLGFLVLGCFVISSPGAANDLTDRVEHGYVDSKGVKIHYAKIGNGPLMVMLHGYPDYWYTWRHQMEALSKQFTVVAIDLRGYNKSDKPTGVQNYAMRLLIGDVTAVIRHFGEESAVVVGHDWGGAIAWQVATWVPQMVDNLIILSTPHTRGLFRELRKNPEQQQNSQYAQDFQKEDAHTNLSAESLASWVGEPGAKSRYLEAFRRSDFEAMLNYYKANFPRPSASQAQQQSSASQPQPIRKIQCPTLVIHGLDDKALLPAGFNSTWEIMDSDLTMVSIPNAGHFVQHEATDLVTRSIVMWLNR
jgi:pimeloyl-ACP methyl ester carboxylesterase